MYQCHAWKVDMDKVYSIKHLGLFSTKLLTIKDDGFYYKNKRYSHDDIKMVNVAVGRGRALVMGVKLNDGNVILVNAGALELNGTQSKTGFFSGNNAIFDELKDYFVTPAT